MADASAATAAAAQPPPPPPPAPPAAPPAAAAAAAAAAPEAGGSPSDASPPSSPADAAGAAAAAARESPTQTGAGLAATSSSSGAAGGAAAAAAPPGGLPPPVTEALKFTGAETTELRDEERAVLMKAMEEGRLRFKTEDDKTLYLSLPQGVQKGDVSVMSATETAMRRAQERADLQCELDELTDMKKILAQQIQALKAPVQAESDAMKALQSRVADEESFLVKLKNENRDAKGVRQQEAKNLEARVVELKAVIGQEQTERERQENRLKQLQEENAKLRRELEEEKRTLEWQKAEQKRCDKSHEDVSAEQRKLLRQAKNTEELTDEVNARCNDLSQQQKVLKNSCRELRAELLKVKHDISQAQTTLANKGDHTELRKQYEEKMKIWNALETPAKLKEDLDFMSRENKNLQSNLAKAESEHDHLGACARMLHAAMQRARQAKEMLSRENSELLAAMSALNQDAAALQTQEDTWSSDDGDDDHGEGAYYDPYVQAELDASDSDSDSDSSDGSAADLLAAAAASGGGEAAEVFFRRPPTDPAYVASLKEVLGR